MQYSFDQLLNANIYSDHVDILFMKKIIFATSSFITLKCQDVFYSSQAYSHAIHFDTHSLTVQLGVCGTHPGQFYTAIVSYLCPNNNNLPATGKSLIEQLGLVTRKSPPFFEIGKKQIFHATTKLQPKVIGRVYDFLFIESIGELLIL